MVGVELRKKCQHFRHHPLIRGRVENPERAQQGGEERADGGETFHQDTHETSLSSNQSQREALSVVHYPAPMSQPARKTRMPPTMTWKLADTSGVSMYL